MGISYRYLKEFYTCEGSYLCKLILFSINVTVWLFDFRKSHECRYMIQTVTLTILLYSLTRTSTS